MSGTHKFTSSVWIQSGSTPAVFQSGISVSGDIEATRFVGDGTGITGVGTAVFFAGSGSGISASAPSSVDHVTSLDASAAEAPDGYFIIQTTSSLGFNPNHFVFIKLTDKFETLQEGSQDFYIGVDRTVPEDTAGEHPFTNDLAPGVHRYIVYATDTGSAGASHAVYTSAFIDGYVNVPPLIKAPEQSNATVQIAHDENTATFILHFTGSEEPNAAQSDFIRIFSASRLDIDPSTVNTTDASYNLSMQHPQSDLIVNADNLIATGSNDPNNPYLLSRAVYGAGPANIAALPNSVLAFTASIIDYNTLIGTTNHSDTIEPATETFKITMFDNWFVDHSSSLEYSMSIVPPNTASIRNVRARVESGSFTGIATDTLSVPILYDETETRINAEGLHPRYTASLVRISVMADITEPDDYQSDGSHFTDILIKESGNTNKPLHDKTFRFSGSTAGPGLFHATASGYDNGTDFVFTNATESLGFSPFVYQSGTSKLNVTETDDTNNLRHGNHNHISSMQRADYTSITVVPVPNIEISNVRVEVESGSCLTNVGAFQRSASILYGYTSSLLSSETSSLEGYEKSAEYISESVVRIRLLTTITEPFGPHHTKMVSTIQTNNSSYPYSHEFEFYTGSGNTHTESSVIGYDDQNRLVGNYTSSWIDFNLLAGEYTFSASFNSNTTTGRTITPGIYSEVSISATPATEITNIVYETETYGYSYEGDTEATRTVLYGVPRHTLADSESFAGHPNSASYASHSVSRFRVKATVTEPFGPHHTASRFEKVWTNSSDIEKFSSNIHFSTGSTDTASSAIAYDSANRLLSHYTSSWVGQQLSSSIGNPKTWKYTSGSITHTPHDLSGFVTTSGISTQIIVNDTAQIQLTNRFIEFEEYGHSASSATDTGVTATTRTVLYGSDHKTLTDSSSISTHPNSASYASQSVSRYRIRFKVTEPVGPAVGSITIPVQINSGLAILTKNANTGSSTEFESIGYIYNSETKLVANYTSSWIGQQITLSPSDYNTDADYTFAVINANVINTIDNENGINKESQQPALITVQDTVPTQITNVRYETETFGYSEEPSTDTTRKVLYGIPHHTVANSSSFSTHGSASLYASQSVTRFRVLATITEPVGPLHTASRFERVWSADSETTLTDTLHFNTASTDIATSSAVYNTSNELVVDYTSSWIGQQLSSSNFDIGQEWTYTSGSILHNPSGENSVSIINGLSSVITVYDTQPTIFSNFKTETETFGYSEEPTQSAIRTVLYGVNGETEVDSGSYVGHVNADIYASHSVSRFRIVTTITEPVGPLQHTASIIEKTFTRNIYSSPQINATKTDLLIFGTASGDFISSRSFFNTSSGEFISEYTSSWIGENLTTNANTANGNTIWQISTGSVDHNPPGENSANSSSFTATIIKVQNTAETQINNIVYETETAGHSEEGSISDTRTVLYGVPRHTLADSESFAGHTNADVYARQSVTRFRVKATVTEPVGPLHTASRFEKVWKNDKDDERFDSVIHFQTASGDLFTQSLLYNSAAQLIVDYTSSWIGQQLSSSNNAAKTWTYTSESIIHNPTTEPVAVTAIGSSTELVINDTPKVQIENIFWETETHGYSDIETSDTRRTVLYGNNRTTDINSSSYANHPNSGSYASQSVSRVRFRARVTEPVGPAVDKFTVNFTYDGDDHETDLHTGSIETYGGAIATAYENNQLVTHYTSSYFGVLYDVPAGGTRIHNLEGDFSENINGENGIVQSDKTDGTITVIDTEPTQIDSVIYETETFGYSGVESQDTFRRVLYGDTQVTNRDTSSLSWKNHESASLYASHSVTRFRIRARIIEPVGPLHTASRFEKVWKNNLGRIDLTDVIHFSTSSTDIATSSIVYNTSNQLVVDYTSSFIGRGLSSSVFAKDDNANGESYLYTSGSILHTANNELPANITIGESSTIVVYDTQPTEFNNILLQTETYGYSGIVAPSGSRKVLYGIPHHTIAGTGSVYWATHESASLYASQSVTQFRISARITEPIGYHHTGSIITQQFTSNLADNSAVKIESILSQISNIQSSTPNINVNNAFNGNRGYNADNDEIITIIFTESQLISRIDIESNPSPSNLGTKVFASPDAGITFIEIQDIINNTINPDRPYRYFKIEFGNNQTTNVDSISFFRANFTEPILYNNTTFKLDPLSAEIPYSRSFYDDQSRLVSEYSSSFFGVQLSSSDNTSGEEWKYNVSHIIHNPIDGSNISQSANITPVTMRVYDTAAPQYENFKTETETFGYSEEPTQDSMRTVLYGNTQITDIDSSSYANHPSASIYASHSVSRFRVVAQITEPVGPLLHTGSRSNMIFNDDVSKTKTIIFGTASDAFVQSFSTPVGEFVTEYTSSWISRSLESGVDFTNWTIQNETPIHVTVDENAPTNTNSATILKVRNTEPTQIDSIAYQTETRGNSGIPTIETSRKVLYGDIGVTNTDSSSFADHPNTEIYTSESITRFRVTAKITEPVGPLHAISEFQRVWSADSETTLTDTLQFSTASNVISNSFSDELGRLVVQYTSSFTGKALAAPNAITREWKYTSGSITHAPSGENGSTIAIGDSSTVTVNGTSNTVIQNLRVETETVGYSNIGVQNTTEVDHSIISRSILYGESASFANSASFPGLNIIFAESSVTRFRVLADIIEPLGPHHTGSLIAYTKDAKINLGAGALSSETVPFGEGISDSIIFSTSSTQLVSSDIAYNTNTKELESSYTSSWFEESLSPSKVLTDGYWHINVNTANIHHTPVDESGVTKDNSAANLYMVVSASKPLEITNLRTEVEAFPYSSSIGTTTRTEEILYGFNRTLSASDANTIGDIWSGSAAIRMRTLATITEPIGFRHFKTQFTMSNASVGSRGYEFHTASLETASRSARILNYQGQFTTHYTSAFHDGFTFNEGSNAFTPSAKTGSDTVGIYMDTNGINVTPIGSNAEIVIADTPATQITNVRIEAETFSGSAVGTDSRTTTILHGNTVTETDKEVNAEYPNATARQQLTSVRLLANIAEPFGPHHTASVFTIAGYDGNSHTVTFNTGSGDIGLISKQMYDTHGSSSIAYTSSFVPLQLTTGIKDLNISSTVHGFEDNKSETSIGNHADITVNSAPAATVTVAPKTASGQYWSSSADITNYVTYNKEENLQVNIISGISATAPTETSESILIFPDHLNIRYKATDAGLSFNTVNATVSGQDTSSLTIANSLMKDLTKVTTYTVNVSGSDILPGNGTSGDQPLEFKAIPAKPQSMDGMYWGPGGTDHHDSTGNAYTTTGINVPSISSNTTQLYTGSLSTGLDFYSPNIANDSGFDNPGDVVNNIMMAKNTALGPANYSMSFTPFTPVTEGNYENNNRLFDHGDSGSLVVKINSLTVVNYSLQDNFDPNRKHITQDLSEYPGEGIGSFTDAHDALAANYVDLGRLIITQIQPFNEVSQSIFNAGTHYPNGYQGWSARIEIDNKLNDGYNKIEFEHVFDDGTKQSWSPFEWYYDDTIEIPVTRHTATASFTDTGVETFALSGVKFFNEGVNIPLIFKDSISNIAGSTYGNKANTLMQTEIASLVQLNGAFSTITHNLDDAPNGLHFGDDVNDLIPIQDQSASLSVTINVPNAVTDIASKGDTHTLRIKQYQRDFSVQDTFTVDTNGQEINVGRFIDGPNRPGLTVSVDNQEKFFFENYRWLHTTMNDNTITSQLDPGGTGVVSYPQTTNNFAHWIDTSVTDFDSTADILNLSELQVRWNGALMYPNESYTNNNLPNSVDYSGAGGDRYFYRAFKIGQDNINAFEIKVEYDPDFPVTQADIWAQEPDPVNFPGTNSPIDSRNIRIDIKYPGPLSGAPAGLPIAPGTEWGSICGGSGASGGPMSEDWVSTSTPVISAATNAWNIQMRTGNWNTTFPGQIVLMRVRFKQGTTARITGITMAPL